MKIVINNCFGGFGLSEKAMRAYFAKQGRNVFKSGDGLSTTYFDAPVPKEFELPEGELFMRRGHPEYERYRSWYEEHVLSDRDIPRDDPDLVAVVEELGSDVASDAYGRLVVVDIPDGVQWQIEEYDGSEHVAEVHRTWS